MLAFFFQRNYYDVSTFDWFVDFQNKNIYDELLMNSNTIVISF